MKPPDYALAKAVEEAVVNCGMLAHGLKDSDPARSRGWELQADKLELKYKTEHGEHYAETIRRGEA